MRIKNKPNLLFLIAVRSQKLYKKLVIVLRKLQQPVYRKKLIRAYTKYHIQDYNNPDNPSSRVERWFLNGQPHREDGPAVIFHKAHGTDTHYEHWYIHGKLHRDGFPAIVGSNGYEKWFKHGYQHRDDGPSLVWPDGRSEYSLNDQLLSYEEFQKKIAKNEN
jgi:hypothetical protein